MPELQWRPETADAEQRSHCIQCNVSAACLFVDTLYPCFPLFCDFGVVIGEHVACTVQGYDVDLRGRATGVMLLQVPGKMTMCGSKCCIRRYSVKVVPARARATVVGTPMSDLKSGNVPKALP